ncbi:MAG: hypothetical protein ABW210_06375 [Achromobacter sp.]
MVRTQDLIQRVPHGVEKVLIGREYVPLQIELDNGLRAINRVELADYLGSPLATRRSEKFTE